MRDRPPTLSGIKKQACINRKCLLMVPRDEDGERLARKRAKQRTLPPSVMRIHHVGAPTAEELSMAAGAGPMSMSIMQPMQTGGMSRNPSFSVDSPRSDCSSPDADAFIKHSWGLQAANGLQRHQLSEEEAEMLGAEEAARAQALSEQCLYTLALDDEDEDPAGRALTSAMLFAAIQTPASSPQRQRDHHATVRHTNSPLGKRGGAADAAKAAAESAAAKAAAPDSDARKEETPKAAPEPSLALLKAELGIEDESAEDKAMGEASEKPPPPPPAPVLTPAFSAQIAAKLELDEPPKPPRLDELHEEFLLLNAEHRCSVAYAEEMPTALLPILAY